MTPAERGWWQAQVPSVRPGSDYAFRLDGGRRLPDPRSLWQPCGPDGPSRVLDHASFPWSDAEWQPIPLASAVIYELHVGTFTRAGTFDAAIERLDHLAHLGITHVELMPVAEFPGRWGWGYDGVSLFAPHHAYGGPDGLKRLVNACHAQGLAVLLDVVYNHLGAGNSLDRFGPYFSDRHSTPWGPGLNLDGRDSDEVRRFLVDNAEMWLRDYHLDGLRLDAVHAIVDTSPMHLLEELASAARAMEAGLGRRVVLIAESGGNDPRLLHSPARGGCSIDAMWNDDFHHALHALLTGERSGYYADFGLFSDLAKALTSGFVLDGRYSAYRGRRYGRSAAGLAGERFVAFLQNHDQVGNRARGERASHLLPVDRLKIAAALVLTSPFVPLLFQGEEWGASTPFPYFLECDDAAVSRAVLVGREKDLTALGWDASAMPDPRAPETHAQAVLDWGELDHEPHAQMLDWHRELIRLRRRFPALSDGRMDQVRVRFDDRESWFVLEHGPITVACNLSEVPRLVSMIGQDILLASNPRLEVVSEGVCLPPDSVAVLASR